MRDRKKENGLRQTKFSDVCGTLDELKRLVNEEKEKVVADHDRIIAPLLEDAGYMLQKMDQRLEEYRN